MATGTGMIGAPENQLMHAALCQLGSQFYKMPVECAGFATDGTIAEQTVFQKAANGLMACLSGANLAFGIGMVDLLIASSPVQLVIDNDITGVVRRICRGFEINDDTLGLEAIRRVEPRGNFLTDQHTLKYVRTDEFYRPSIFNRDPRTSWLEKGGKSLEQKAREKALTILKEHEVEPLDEDVAKELRAIVSRADRELAI
jgi:trimethylamine--corrinoid protein Co-methyltransferase